MGLYRLALRLAVMEALRPTALIGNPAAAWPTLARDHVFDSRIDPIDDLPAAGAVPVIAVYTEADEGTSSQNRGGPPFYQRVDLTFEISQVARVTSADDPNLYAAGIPQTDPELEAELDRMEYEIGFALYYAPSGVLFRKLSGRKVTDPRSHPYRTSEEGARLARRTITWKVGLDSDLGDGSPVITPIGLARLPDPLASVITALGATTYGARLAKGLAATLPVMPVATPLKTVAMAAEVTKPGGAEFGHPPAGQTGDLTERVSSTANMNAEADGLDQ